MSDLLHFSFEAVAIGTVSCAVLRELFLAAVPAGLARVIR